MILSTSAIFSAGNIVCGGKFLDRRLEIAVVVNVADDEFGDGLLLVGQIGFARLIHQHLREGSSGRERVEHELPLFLVLGGLADRGVRLGKIVAPFLVELHELVEFLLKFVRRRGLGFLKIRLAGHFIGAFGGVELGGGVAVVADLFDRFFRQFHIRALDFFEDGILLEFLFDERLEFEHRCLQQRQRLLELRREHHGLRQARGELQALNHCAGR